MKLFYVLTIAVLMSFFGIGCDGGGGDDDVAPIKPNELPVASVYSAVQGEVKVESGELGTTLKVSECIGILANDLPSLKVSRGDDVFCGDGGTPCVGHLKLIFCNAGEIERGNCVEAEQGKRKLIASNVSCNPELVLAKKEEAPAGSSEPGSATTTQVLIQQ